MNGQHQNIQFTMEIEKDNSLPFLDIFIQRKEDGTLGHQVYRKPTHTDLYLNGLSHHHPSQKRAVISTLLHRANIVADKDSLPQEIKHLRETFRRNGYTEREISLAIIRTDAERKENRVESFLEPDVSPRQKKPIARACLPYVSTVAGKVSRILAKWNIETIHIPPQKLRGELMRVKDNLGLRTPGVYRIPCQCGKVYIGETGRTIETRIKEHRRCIRLFHPEKSALADHSLSEDHVISFHDAQVLSKAHLFWDRLLKEAIEIRLEAKNLNRDSGFHISKQWRPLIQKLTEKRRQQCRPD